MFGRVVCEQHVCPFVVATASAVLGVPMSVAPVRRRRRAFALVGAALGMCWALTACSEDAPEPAPLKSPAASQEPSESPEPSATPSDGPPEMPEAAKGTSKKSAEAFVRYAVDVLNYATLELDPAAIEAISDPACKACRSILVGLKEVRRDAGDINGGAWRVKRVEALPSPVRNGWTVQTLIKYSEQEVLASRRGDVEVLPAGSTMYDFFVANGDGQKRLLELRRS
jgi:hypothetical protein